MTDTDLNKNLQDAIQSVLDAHFMTYPMLDWPEFQNLQLTDQASEFYMPVDFAEYVYPTIKQLNNDATLSTDSLYTHEFSDIDAYDHWAYKLTSKVPTATLIHIIQKYAFDFYQNQITQGVAIDGLHIEND